jgi:glycosyltransferase involved in cell wall biosynthesis
MRKDRKPTVAYAFPVSHHFRAKFHEILRAQLALKNIEYRYIYDADDSNSSKRDTTDISWAKSAQQFKLKIGNLTLKFHRIGRHLKNCDLLILQQENALIANYYWQIKSYLGGPKVAFFGHGKNFQSRNPNGLAERWKAFWSTKVHWWFAYTQRCANIVESNGFAKNRITVFNNSIDIQQIENERQALDYSKLDAMRKHQFYNSQNIAVYVGAIYADKRPEFLIAAALEIRKRVPDFQLIAIGSGPEAHIVEKAATEHAWIHAVGPKFGMEKTELVSLAKVWLMPGLVGLAVLDSFAYEVPMVTTNLSFHSPEIDYLDNGINGLIINNDSSVDAYANEVSRLFENESLRQKLVEGCRLAKSKYSIEEMASRFATGVLEALY